MSSVSDIVEEAGIGRGTFYLYFGSKKEIFLALIEAYFKGFAMVLEDNHDFLERAFRGRDKVLRVWRDNMMRVLEYHRDNPSLTAIVYREALGRDEDFSARVEELEVLAREKLGEEFQLMYDRGMIRECDTKAVSTIVMGSTMNIIMEYLIGDSDQDLDELADMIMEYHIRALIPEGGNIERAVKSALAMDSGLAPSGENHNSLPGQ